MLYGWYIAMQGIKMFAEVQLLIDSYSCRTSACCMWGPEFDSRGQVIAKTLKMVVIAVKCKSNLCAAATQNTSN